MTGPPGERPFRASGAAFVVMASVIGAAGAYLFQALGTRSLGAAAFAPIAVLWTLLFILFTIVLAPLEQSVTRQASLGRAALGRHARAIVVTTVLGAAAGLGFILLTLDELFRGRLIFAAQWLVLVAGYGALFVGRGVLAGRRRFREVGWILIGESLARLFAGVVFLAAFASSVSLVWAMAIAPLSALATRFWRHDRETEAAGRGASAGSVGSFLGAYIAGSAASQILLAGAPLAVAALGGSPELVSVVFVTWTLFRGPLTLIYSLQGLLLPYLVRMARDDVQGVRKLATRVLLAGGALATLAGLLGFLAGPQVVAALFGAEARPDALTSALAAAGFVAASTTQVAGQTLVARGRTGALAMAWTIGLLAAFAVLPLSNGIGPDRTVAIAFTVGEFAATVAVAALILRDR